MPWNDDPEAARLHHDTLLLVEEQGEAGPWSWDFEQKRLRWSNGMYRIPGLPAFAQEPSAALFNGLVHPDDRIDGEDAVAGLQAPGGRHRRLIRGDGEMRWVRSRARVILDAADQPERIVGGTFEVTERAPADAARPRKDWFFDAAEELVGGTMWLRGVDGAVRDAAEWRRGASRCGGAPVGPAAVAEDVRPDDRAAVRQALEPARGSGCRYAAEYRARRNGSRVGVASRAVAIRDPLGSTLAWVGSTSRQPGRGNSGDTGALALQPGAGQICGARGLLGWTASELGARSRLSFSTIRRAEAEGDGGVGGAAAAAIRVAFAAVGVDVAATPEGAVSVSLAAPARRPRGAPAGPTTRGSPHRVKPC